ncbi:alpha/beta fold hydrolase [Alteromonas aestuariivivens]|uniref:Alpha/beta fold hydrolase n=2 Tax=Alteromonas aestuariivivens TaxID=1938339 RepID=A0A3D8MDZ3_9ALTE|nr:alpha/beta fold hydrolase [Alteromonas aestuariivivens]
MVWLAGALCQIQAQPLDPLLDKFAELYTSEWGQVKPCPEPAAHRFRVCSDKLRNEGNAPFILHHGVPTANTAILIHGLSDSPFFVSGIAQVLYEKGFTVIAPLLPGHGLKVADADMEDKQLAERWQQHVDQVVALTDGIDTKVFLGGFSTGGALSVEQYLDSPAQIDGLMLFSGALALTDNAESMSKFWGIKWVAKLIDGHYETDGPNPYKYPSVAGFAGLELMDVINQIRDQLEAGKRIEVPLFAAHSQADRTTPIHGIEGLLEFTRGSNTVFIIDESYNLCHADLVVSEAMIRAMQFDKSRVNGIEECAVPKANPLYRQMTMMLQSFVDEHQGR